MCSLTWLRRPDGYELFFNRDEARTRLPALPPAPRRRAGVEILAALDADAGGTWLGVNAHGLSVGLLNGLALGLPPADPISRGLLVLDLLDAPDSEEVARRLAGLDLARRRPFQLIALEPAAALLSARWDGARLVVERLADERLLLSSSSLDPAGAEGNRRRVLDGLLEARGRPTEDLLLDFHASHDPAPSAVSACMHRDDAQTVSLTRTRVSAAAVELGYSPAAPCRGVPLTWLGIERRPAARSRQGARGSRAPSASAGS